MLLMLAKVKRSERFTKYQQLSKALLIERRRLTWNAGPATEINIGAQGKNFFHPNECSVSICWTTFTPEKASRLKELSLIH